MVHAMNAEQRQTAADLWTKPTNMSHRPAYETAFTIAIYYYPSQKLYDIVRVCDIAGV